MKEWKTPQSEECSEIIVVMRLTRLDYTKASKIIDSLVFALARTSTFEISLTGPGEVQDNLFIPLFPTSSIVPFLLSFFSSGKGLV
jgi:hypothetical protein